MVRNDPNEKKDASKNDDDCLKIELLHKEFKKLDSLKNNKERKLNKIIKSTEFLTNMIEESRNRGSFDESNFLNQALEKFDMQLFSYKVLSMELEYNDVFKMIEMIQNGQEFANPELNHILSIVEEISTFFNSDINLITKFFNLNLKKINQKVKYDSSFFKKLKEKLKKEEILKSANDFDLDGLMHFLIFNNFSEKEIDFIMIKTNSIQLKNENEIISSNEQLLTELVFILDKKIKNVMNHESLNASALSQKMISHEKPTHVEKQSNNKKKSQSKINPFKTMNEEKKPTSIFFESFHSVQESSQNVEKRAINFDESNEQNVSKSNDNEIPLVQKNLDTLKMSNFTSEKFNEKTFPDSTDNHLSEKQDDSQVILQNSNFQENKSIQEKTDKSSHFDKNDLKNIDSPQKKAEKKNRTSNSKKIHFVEVEDLAKIITKKVFRKSLCSESNKRANKSKKMTKINEDSKQNSKPYVCSKELTEMASNAYDQYFQSFIEKEEINEKIKKKFPSKKEIDFGINTVEEFADTFFNQVLMSSQNSLPDKHFQEPSQFSKLKTQQQKINNNLENLERIIFRLDFKIMFQRLKMFSNCRTLDYRFVSSPEKKGDQDSKGEDKNCAQEKLASSKIDLFDFALKTQNFHWSKSETKINRKSKRPTRVQSFNSIKEDSCEAFDRHYKLFTLKEGKKNLEELSENRQKESFEIISQSNFVDETCIYQKKRISNYFEIQKTFEKKEDSFLKNESLEEIKKRKSGKVEICPKATEANFKKLELSGKNFKENDKKTKSIRFDIENPKTKRFISNQIIPEKIHFDNKIDHSKKSLSNHLEKQISDCQNEILLENFRISYLNELYKQISHSTKIEKKKIIKLRAKKSGKTFIKNVIFAAIFQTKIEKLLSFENVLILKNESEILNQEKQNSPQNMSINSDERLLRFVSAKINDLMIDFDNIEVLRDKDELKLKNDSICQENGCFGCKKVHIRNLKILPDRLDIKQEFQMNIGQNEQFLCLIDLKAGNKCLISFVVEDLFSFCIQQGEHKSDSVVINANEILRRQTEGNTFDLDFRIFGEKVSFIVEITFNE